MKNFIVILVIGFGCLGQSAEVVNEGAAAKTMYKKLDSVMGAVCSDSRCLVMAGAVSCSYLASDTKTGVCTATEKYNTNQVFTFLGNQARSIISALTEFREPTCQSGSCTNFVSAIECTSYGILLPDYRCRAEVIE